MSVVVVVVVLGGVNGRSLLQLCVTCDQVNAVLFYCLVVEDLVATLVSDGGTGSGGVKDKWEPEMYLDNSGEEEGSTSWALRLREAGVEHHFLTTCPRQSSRHPQESRKKARVCHGGDFVISVAQDCP
ncbi:hypothetical protein O3P69_005135 [Scylla paramamosain]|uniref:Uncharacterized protein n=1 Tax=Scylla paramamosain TaxID=85552 RepID=A0AAW0UFC3_SCYPA